MHIWQLRWCRSNIIVMVKMALKDMANGLVGTWWLLLIILSRSDIVCCRNNWLIKQYRYIIPSRGVAGKIPHPDNAFKTFNISYCLCGRPKELSLNTSAITKLDLLWMQISMRWKMVLDRTLTPAFFLYFPHYLNSPLFEKLE